MPAKDVVTKPLRAAIYVRVSSERQAAEDRVSVESQLADCEAYCRERGYLIAGHFIDKDKYRAKGRFVQPSGERKDRPAYTQMLDAAQRGEFEVIVAWKEDRLYRGMYAAVPLAELLDTLGARLQVELIREVFDRRMLGIKAAIGKIEVDNIKERTLMGRRARLERGEVPGGDQVRFGYRKVDHVLEINEQEAEIVRQMFDWYVSGVPHLEIKRRLNARGEPTRSGNPWAKSTITGILYDESYATGKRKTVLNDEEFEIPCPSIITVETWNKALQVRQRNKSKPRNLKEDYLCAGLVYCNCGWKCQAKTNRGNEYRGYTTLQGYYGCQRINYAPETIQKTGCAKKMGAKTLDATVWSFVKRICSQPELVQLAIAYKIDTLALKHAEVEDLSLRLNNQLATLAEERQWVITQARKGNINESDMEEQLASLTRTQAELTEKLNLCSSTITAGQQISDLATWAGQYLREIQAGLAALESEVDKLSKPQFQALYEELHADKYAEKFPEDLKGQLRWATLEEKRKIVRSLINRVDVRFAEDGKTRIATPHLYFELPLLQKSVRGDQSLSYDPIRERTLAVVNN